MEASGREPEPNERPGRDGDEGSGRPDAARAPADRRRIGYAVTAALVLAVAVIAVVAAAGGGDSSDFPPEVTRAAERAGCTVEKFESEGQQPTTEPVDYKSDPPHSGAVFADAAPDGDYSRVPESRLPPTEEIVHALLHGRVVIWFSSRTSRSERHELRSLFGEDTYHVLLAPDDTMSYAVAESAWTRVLACNRLSPQALEAMRVFRDRYRDQAPERVP